MVDALDMQPVESVEKDVLVAIGSLYWKNKANRQFQL